MQKLRETLTLILIGLLPFHALLVTAGTKLVFGAGNAPSVYLVVWKEALLGVILLLALIGIAKAFTQEQTRKDILRLDRLDAIILLLVILSVFVTAATHGDWKLYLFGFKYDFVPLVAFMLLRRVPWSHEFRERVAKLIIGIACILVAFGLVGLFAPQSFFTFLGYSDMHSLYQPNQPLAAFQQISGTAVRRMQSAMSGPNQLGIWLLIPLGLLLFHWLHCRLPHITWMETFTRWAKTEEGQHRCKATFLIALLALGIILTFSRASWIAAAVITVVAFAQHCSKEVFQRWTIRFGAIFAFIIFLIFMLSPNTILRVTTSGDHFKKPMEAVQRMMSYPLGRGLGTAGPASNRINDVCVHLPKGADAAWASNQPDLCVFVGQKQVQPAGKICKCPFHSENWYLQFGVELGLAGFVLFLALVILVLRRLRQAEEKTLAESLFLGFLGVSIAALVLHAWEDSAVAYTLWILLASLIPLSHRKEEVV